jgi:CheY-like chemotaxis protein
MRRLLVVDDDPMIGRAIGVSAACSGAGRLAVRDATSDLMSVDVVMPDMRGFESIGVVLDRAPIVPLVTISGSAFDDPETADPDASRLAARPGEPQGRDGGGRRDRQSKSNTQRTRADQASN